MQQQTTMKSYRVLSIDAWGNQEEGYDWNAWFTVGSIECDIDDNDSVLRALVDLLGGDYARAKAEVDFDDDGLNVVVVDANDRRPLYAVEYESDI